MTLVLNIKTNFEANTNTNFKSNDAPYYLLNINENDEMKKFIEWDKYSDIVFDNLYTHYTSITFEEVIQKEFNINTRVNLIDEKTDLIKYINYFISDSELMDKYERGEVIECPLFFIKGFYSKFNNQSFSILKSKYLKKYIDSIFIVKRNDVEGVEIKSFEMFESYFNEYINPYLLEYSMKVYEALKYIRLNNFYGQLTNRYTNKIEENKKDYYV